MEDTGDRPDIGPVTEYQALYINTKNDEALKAVLAQGEGAASMPIHFRDENTGGPIDFFQYPYANWYGYPQGKTWIKGPYTIRDEKGRMTCEWHMNSSHEPAVSFVPYLLTGDPYYLEEMQFLGTQDIGWTSFHRSETHLEIADPMQTRGYAWSLRTLIQLARVSPTNPPKWLKPSSYWKRIIDDNLKWFTMNYVRNPSRATTIFHAATKFDAVAAWQEEFLAFILGWAVWMGLDNWKEAYLWKLQATLARTNGTSGWPRQFCTPYYYAIGKSVPNDALYTSKVDPSVWYTDWTEAWEAFKAAPNHRHAFKSGDPNVFTDNFSWQQSNGKDYLIYTRAVLAQATQLGVKEAFEPYSFVNKMVDSLGYMTNRWSVFGLDQ